MSRIRRWGGGMMFSLATSVAQAQSPAPPSSPGPAPPASVIQTLPPGLSTLPGPAQSTPVVQVLPPGSLPPGSLPPTSLPPALADVAQPQRPTSGLDSHSLPAEINEIITPGPVQNRLGPTAVSDVRFLMDSLGFGRLFGDSGIRTFGWADAGYTYSTGGSGLQATQPRLNRFGNEFLFNELGLVLQKPLKQDQWDWGFNVRYFAGANAATGQPRGGIDDPPGNNRFSHDFRDLFLSAHLPILTEGGVNVQVGRMNTIIGWNGFLAPYRPLPSSDYQFFYSQDGAFTGFLTEVVVSDRLDVWNGMTLGANTFYTKRSENSYCYIGQVNYWLQEEKRTRLTASTYLGPDAIFAAPGMNGDFVSMVEVRVQQNWTDRFMQVVQSNFGWDTNTPVGTGSWFGVYTVGILNLTTDWDVIGRAEWFRDVRGTRTGFDTNYSEVTFGLNWHPNRYVEFRPEVRGDFAGEPAFGGGNNPTDRSQLTLALSALTKF